VNALTWLAIAVLAPGACAIFAWFLRDLRSIVDGAAAPPPPPPRDRPLHDRCDR
jgi:hypothetical protein